jgi:DNA-binding NarL/FixJ family response regulator
MTGKTRILIADDHELVRQGVRHTLESVPEWEVVGEASNGPEAIDLSEKTLPDVVVLDLTMPGMSGLDAIRPILKASPETRILVVSIHDSDELIHEVLAAGARGYLLKSDAARDLISAVQSLLAGRVFFTAKVSQALIHHYVQAHAPAASAVALVTRLTTREQEIVRLVAKGMTNKEVATQLNISVRTVESHRSNIMEKLGIHSVSDLILYAVRQKLIAEA